MNEFWTLLLGNILGGLIGFFFAYLMYWLQKKERKDKKQLKKIIDLIKRNNNEELMNVYPILNSFYPQQLNQYLTLPFKRNDDGDLECMFQKWHFTIGELAVQIAKHIGKKVIVFDYGFGDEKTENDNLKKEFANFLETRL